MRGFLLVGAFLAFASSASAATPRVLAIHFDADVNPVTQNYLCDNLSRAAKDGYSAAVIVLNTPGGRGPSERRYRGGARRAWLACR